MNFSKFFSPLLFPTSTILPNISINVEKKIHQIGSNIFEPVPSLSLSLSLIFLPNETPREGRVRGSDEGGEGGGGG